MTAQSSRPDLCIVCGSVDFAVLHKISDRLYRTTEEVFTIARCQGCGLARLSPLPSETKQFYPEGYWYEPSRLEETYRRIVLSDHVRFVRRALNSGPVTATHPRVLDVGCGSGFFLRRLRAAVPSLRVTGLDISPRAAALATRHNKVAAVAGSLLDVSFDDASFDLVTMFHVLEHLPNPGAYLDAARRLLSPGGRLVVQTPNLDCWQYRLTGVRWNGLDVPRHLYDFRLKDLRRLLHKHGFEVVRVKHFSLRDNPAGLATTLFPDLDPVARATRGNRSGNVVYALLTATMVPFALVEALFGHGSTMMIEASPR